MEKTKEYILTEIFKRSISHIEGFENLKLHPYSEVMFSEALEAMKEENKLLEKYKHFK